MKSPVADHAPVAAVPTTSGWKLFGLLWYWWVLLSASVMVAGRWLGFLIKDRIARLQQEKLVHLLLGESQA